MSEIMESAVKPGLSFGFSKKSEQKKLVQSVIDESKQGKEEVDYITFLEENSVKSTKPVEEKAELIIPLIQHNRWRQAKKPEDLETDKDVEASTNILKIQNIAKTGDDITDKAVTEILTDAAKQKEKLLNGDDFKIPLLLRNKIPDGFETDDNLDVSLRPDEATEEEYEAVPIEQFGAALLRGMGWKEGDGIGRNNQRCKPVESVPRPKGLGLGADRSVALQKVKVASSHAEHDGNIETLTMKTGAFCVIIRGKLDGQYGVIAGVDEDNARVMVTMALGGEVVSLSQHAVELVTKKDFDKNKKYLNKPKADRVTSESTNHENENSRDHDHHSSPDRDHHSHKHKRRHKHEHTKHSSKHKRHRHASSDQEANQSDDKQTDQHRNSRSHKHQSDRDTDRSSKQSINNDKQNCKTTDVNNKDAVWLKSHLAVRIIDEKYQNGKYFKTKVVVEDVLGGGGCVCRTTDGKILDDLRESQLETVIPRQDPAYVMIVRGEYRSQVGEVLQRNKSACQAVVQLLRDRDKLVTISYDDICEYAADVTTMFDF